MDNFGAAMGVVREYRMGRAGLRRLLAELDAREQIDGTTVYVTSGHFLEGVDAIGPIDPARLEALTGLAAGVERWGTGAVVFWGGSDRDDRMVVVPPFPVEREQTLHGIDTSILMASLAKEYLVGVVLLRLGRYAVGVFRGETLVSSKTDTRYVKGRHSAGGTSQKRFQRIREKQVRELFDKTCSIVRDKFDGFEGKLDYVFLGGERYTLQGLLKRCAYLQELSPKIIGRTLNVREPRHTAFEGVIESIWESRVLRVG